MFNFFTQQLLKFKSLLLAALLVPYFAVSAPIYNFEMELTISQIVQPCDSNSDAIGFGCSASIGDKWLGFFQISTDPTSILESAFSSPFLSMHLKTGESYWDHCILDATCPYSDFNLLEGYRNFLDEYFNITGPAFNVSNGEIISFLGGYFGQADATFIDFDISGVGTFAALDLTNQYVRGTYEIRRVSEPNLFFLFFICVVLTAYFRKAAEL